jgi:hypothetical protein
MLGGFMDQPQFGPKSEQIYLLLMTSNFLENVFENTKLHL